MTHLATFCRESLISYHFLVHFWPLITNMEKQERNARAGDLTILEMHGKKKNEDVKIILHGAYYMQNDEMIQNMAAKYKLDDICTHFWAKKLSKIGTF